MPLIQLGLVGPKPHVVRVWKLKVTQMCENIQIVDLAPTRERCGFNLSLFD